MRACVCVWCAKNAILCLYITFEVLHIFIFVDLAKHGLRNVVGEIGYGAIEMTAIIFYYYCTRRDTPTVTQ